ncbi:MULTISPECIES: carboxypeptidase-like regulatory domain-containing protein [Clostridium]|uniref:Carboxypeptidase regulatory-like domain-containing protein n=1 Tax=Clostridium cibarium TaxID=2762247 RepID=A0ABR8PUW1_9CLOT|nr:MULTISPECIES: carboxypeptidase-like regulatory domain-containing protein [Clostridium]MBD7911919.1 carboxypeptidase regulatory-like domain-containing protein [Clostridium cibarium]
MKKMSTVVAVLFLFLSIIVPSNKTSAATKLPSKTINVEGSNVNLDQLEKINVNDLELNNSNEIKTTITPDKSVNSIEKTSNSKMLMSTLNSEEASANRPPVANLAYAVLNPDSEINGKITTNTQIAWLMSYNGTNYTYDPDGDSITNITVAGIPQDSIVQTLVDSNKNIIGFVTQFKTAAQYTMLFQVQDSKGALSNVYNATLSIEPADGSARPVCKLNTSFSNLIKIGTEYNISWANSTDADSGDSITKGEIVVKKDGNIITDSVISDSKSYTFKVNEVGTYFILSRVQDSKGNWSDWDIRQVMANVPMNIKNVKITSVSDNDFDFNNYGIWFREDDACAQIRNLPADKLYDEFVLYKQPSPGKIIENGFSVEGTVTNTDNTPIANQIVSISLEMPRTTIQKKVATDSTGKFSLQVSKDEFSQYNPAFIKTQYVYFSNYNTMYMYPSALVVTAGSEQKIMPTFVVTNIFKGKVMAKKYVRVQVSDTEQEWRAID